MQMMMIGLWVALSWDAVPGAEWDLVYDRPAMV